MKSIALFYDDKLLSLTPYEIRQGKRHTIRRLPEGDTFSIKLALRRSLKSTDPYTAEYVGKVKYPLTNGELYNAFKRYNDMNKPPIVIYFDFDNTLSMHENTLEQKGLMLGPPTATHLKLIFGTTERQEIIASLMDDLLPHNVYIITANPYIGLVRTVLNSLLETFNFEHRFDERHVHRSPTEEKIHYIKKLHFEIAPTVEEIYRLKKLSRSLLGKRNQQEECQELNTKSSCNKVDNCVWLNSFCYSNPSLD